MQKKKIVTLLFDDVEILDFAGPWEVFGTLEDCLPDTCEFNSIAAQTTQVKARHQLNLSADVHYQEAPKADIFIIPGGRGVDQLLNDREFIAWLTQYSSQTPIVFSVCTGALLLARAGLLKHEKAVTHHSALHRLQTLSPSSQVIESARFTQTSEGKIITTAGVSAGMDAALFLVGSLWGIPAMETVAHDMEYKLSQIHY